MVTSTALVGGEILMQVGEGDSLEFGIEAEPTVVLKISVLNGCAFPCSWSVPGLLIFVAYHLL